MKSKFISLNFMAISILLLLAGCAQSQNSDAENIYTLYRDSPFLQQSEGDHFDPKQNRIHVATFDARDSGNDYNRSNCNIVKELFDNELRNLHGERPQYRAHFWCEKGRYK